ncbi:MAG: mycofactocin biosynthesis glycosyltransferase MftF [Pseudonocardia sp.]
MTTLASPPPELGLPPGFRVALDRRVRIRDGGAVLIGGAPPRLVRLAPAAQRLLLAREFAVADATTAALARRLLDAGIVHPVPAGSASRPDEMRNSRPQDAQLAVTVVVPVKDRTDGLRRLLAALPSTESGDPERARGEGGVTERASGEGEGGVTERASGGGEGGVTERASGGAGGDRAELRRLPGVEVIVVDDGSADPAAVRAVADGAGARVLRHDAPRGPAAARNAGAALARTPLVAFLDSDVVPAPGWLATLRAHFVDPAVALAAPRIVALPPVRGLLGRYEAVRSSLDLGPDPALIVPRTRVAYVPSAALVVRREVLGAGFDERLHVAEDVDLVLRLHAAGWRLRYDPAARVAHDHRTSPRAWWLRKAFYGTGAAPLARRHAGSVPPMVLTPWAAAVAALLLTGRLRWLAVATGIGAVAAERLARSLGAPPLWRAGRARRAVAAVGPARARPASGVASGPVALSVPASAVASGPAAPSAPAASTKLATRPGEMRNSRVGAQRPAPLARPRATAVLLVGLGAAGAVGQTVDAVNRHYWPLAALACLASRRARRTVAVIALAEGIVDWWRADPVDRPPLPAHVLARRLDDLAYGAGLWWGALRHRTVAPLVPGRPGPARAARSGR